MDNLKMLCQTIRFQRAALQNSLALAYAVQQHGQKFLKSTLDQSPWIPGDSKKACLFWADFYTKNLTGVTDLVDQNLSKLERMATVNREKEAKRAKEKPSAPIHSPETPQSSAPEKKTAPEEKTTAKTPHAPVADQPSGQQDRRKAFRRSGDKKSK
jgi:hypothetical protein